MNANKAQLFVPRLLPGVSLANPPAPLTDVEEKVLAHINGTNGLDLIQAQTQMGLKELLLCAKSLVKKQVIQLVKRDPNQAPMTPPPTPLPASTPRPRLTPLPISPALGTVEVKKKERVVDEMAVFEGGSQQRKEAIQKGRAQLPQRPVSSGVHSGSSPAPPLLTKPAKGLMRSMHASGLSDEIERLLAPTEPPPPTPAPAPEPAPQKPTRAAPTPNPDFHAGFEPSGAGDEISVTNEELAAYQGDLAIELPSEIEFSFETTTDDDPTPSSPASAHPLEAEAPTDKGDITNPSHKINDMPLEGESWEAELPFEEEHVYQIDMLEVPSGSYSQPIHKPLRRPVTPVSPLAMPPRRAKFDVTEEVPSISSFSLEVDKTDALQALPVPLAPSKQTLGVDQAALDSLARKLPSDAPPQYILASDIMAGFARVISTFRLYDARNRAVKDALAQLFLQLTQYLEKYDALLLRVEPWAFRCDEQTIYYNNDREGSLSFKLYRDGIRGLKFAPGFDGEELATLLQIIASAQSSVQRIEEDLVTLFWQAQLEHLQVVAVEGFKLRGETNQTPPLQTLFSNLSAEPEAKAATSPTTQGDERRGRGMLKHFLQEEDAQDLLTQLSISPAMHDALGTHASTALQKEASIPWPVQLAPLLDRIEIIVSSSQQAEHPDACQWLAGCAQALLQGGHSDALSALLQRTYGWQNEDSAPLGPAAAAIHAMFQDEAGLMQLFDSLQLKADEPLPDTWLRLFQSSPIDCKPTLYQLLESSLRPMSKAAVRQLLIAMYDDAVGPFVKALEHTSSALSVELLTCLQTIGTAEAIDAICAQIHHPSPAVQDAVMQMAEFLSQGTKQTGQIRQVVARLLASDDPLQRSRAYKVMEQSKDARWATSLHKMIRENNKLDRDEVEALFRLAARLNPESTTHIALELASPPGRLGMERAWRKGQRYGAMQALAQIGNLNAEEALRKLLKSNHNDTKQMAIDAMRELRRNQQSSQDNNQAVTESEAEQHLAQADTKRKMAMSGVSSGSHSREHGSFDDLHKQMINALDQLDLQGDDATLAQLREDGATFISQIHVLFKTAGLYEANNQIFERPLRELLEVQARLFATRDEITIVGLEEQFYIDDMRISMQGANTKMVCRELCAEFASMALGGMIFMAPLDAEEWAKFIHLYVAKEGDKATNWRELRSQIQRSGLGKKIDLISEVTYQVGGATKDQDILDIYALGMNAGEDIWTAILDHAQLDLLPLRRALQKLADFLWEQPGSNLAVLAFTDPHHPVKTHLMNVALLSMRMGLALGFTRTLMVDLGVSAFLHDIGHVAQIPAREQGIPMRDHHEASGALLLKQRFHPAQVSRLLVALAHHDIYTPPLEENAPPSPSLFSRITRLADIYDTLTTRALVGGQPHSPSKLLQRIASDPGQFFDPTLSQALINCLGYYPVGTIVELDDKAIAISMGSGGDAATFEQPRCLIIRGGEAGTKAGQELVLSEPDQPRKIAHQLPPSPTLQPKQLLMKHLKQQHKA